MIRLGLCCKFHLEPIAFKTTTVAALARLPRARQLDKLAALALANASVMAAVASANAGPGIARLLAEELETLTGVSTGTLIGILLPHALSRVANKKSSLRDELLLAAAGMEVYSATPQKERAIKGVEVTLAIYGNLKRALPAGLQQLNIQKHLLARAADAAAKRSGKRYTEADCLAVLDHAW